MVTSRRSAATQAVLDGIGRAIGAYRVALLDADEQAPEPRPRGRLWKPDPHVMLVDVPGPPDGRRLYIETSHEPGPTENLIARLFVRLLAEPELGRPKPPADPRALLLAARSDPDSRPEAMLAALLGAIGSGAGGLALGSSDPRTWTVGPGRGALRTAALEALSGGDGRVEVEGRLFVARRWSIDDVPVGAVALEGDVDRDALAGGVAVLSAVLRPAIEDVTDVALAPVEADLREIVSAFPAPALVVDADGAIVAASAAGEELFRITEFQLGEPAARATRLPPEVFAHGTSLPAEVSVGDRYLEPVAHALSGGGRLVVFLDRGAQAELRRAQEELVAAMAHELRTPIAGMKAFLEVLKLSGDRLSRERLDGMIDEGAKEMSNLERLVGDLLLTTRAATGGINARSDDILLAPIIEDVVRQVRTRYPDRRFQTSGDERAHADPGLVRHALWHLVDNAAKYGGDDDDVSIVMDRAAGMVTVGVTDRGPGIFSGDIDELFRPFRRLERNTTSQHGGAGVGLYLVREILRAQGGDVVVTSRLGHGSTFTARLPASSA